MVIAKNSARVIGFSGLKYPSPYHITTPIRAKDSIYPFAKESSISINKLVLLTVSTEPVYAASEVVDPMSA